MVSLATPPSIAKLAVRGAFWTGAGQYGLFGFGVARVIILARLVDRETFGLIAGATVWASYLSVGRLDLRMAALNSREDREVLDTQFFLENLSAALAFPLAFLAFAIRPQLIAPRGWVLVFVLLVAAQFDALTSTPAYLVDKRLRQDIIGRLTILTAVTGFGVPVLCALLGYPLIALAINAVWPLLLPRIGATVVARWRPGFAWTRDQIHKQLRLAATMWTIGLLSKITFQFDDWLVFNLRRPAPVIWRGTGIEPAALYDRAYGVSKLPMDLVGGLIASNALAIYAERASHGGEVLLSAYRRMTWALSWITFSSGTNQFLAADNLVHVLGEAWVPMVPLIRLMILFIVGRPLLQNCAQVLIALKREHDVRAAFLVQAVFLLIVGPPAAYQYGAAGASAAVSVMSVVGLVVSERYVARRLGQSAWTFYVAPAGAALGAIILTVGLASTLPATSVLAATAKAVVCAIVFAFTLWSSDRSALVDHWRMFRRAWSQA
jgi:O-antigen/teichoic acid export membrane protein